VFNRLETEKNYQESNAENLSTYRAFLYASAKKNTALTITEIHSPDI